MSTINIISQGRYRSKVNTSDIRTGLLLINKITFLVYVFILNCKASVELDQTSKNRFIFISAALPAIDLKTAATSF